MTRGYLIVSSPNCLPVVFVPRTFSNSYWFAWETKFSSSIPNYSGLAWITYESVISRSCKCCYSLSRLLIELSIADMSESPKENLSEIIFDFFISTFSFAMSIISITFSQSFGRLKHVKKCIFFSSSLMWVNIIKTSDKMWCVVFVDYVGSGIQMLSSRSNIARKVDFRR